MILSEALDRKRTAHFLKDMEAEEKMLIIKKMLEEADAVVIGAGSGQIYYNRYDIPAAQTYLDLLGLVRDKNYFVLTTNVDHQFQTAGFDETFQRVNTAFLTIRRHCWLLRQ